MLGPPSCRPLASATTWISHEGYGAEAEATSAGEGEPASKCFKTVQNGARAPISDSGGPIVEDQRCHIGLESSGTAWLALWIGRFWTRPLPKRIRNTIIRREWYLVLSTARLSGS